MTQQLMELFIKYQIPSDLLSCDVEKPNADSIEKLDVCSFGTELKVSTFNF
jgi:hypothetical protein